MTIFKIASRNLMRNKRRAIITTASMTFALFIMIIYTGLTAGFLLEFEHNAVALDISRIQIHEKEYRDDPSIYRGIVNSAEIIQELEKEDFDASGRFFSFALAAADNSSAGVQLRGVDVARESNVTELHKHVNEGEWLDVSAPEQVVIGRKLARTLGVSLGDEIVIVGQTSDGAIANDLYYVRGILKTVSETMDRGGFFMTSQAFRDLIYYNGGAHEIVIGLPTELNLEDAAAKVRLIAPDCEVLDWRKLSPSVAQMMDAMDNSLFMMYFITYAAIGLVILNAMLMAVFERIRELGIMKAVGVTPGQIIGMVMFEAFLQTMLAGVLGILTGLPMVLYLETHGIDLTNLTDSAAISGIALDPIWSTHVTAATVINPFLFMAGIVMLAVIYPGLKAAFIKPVKAIYHR